MLNLVANTSSLTRTIIALAAAVFIGLAGWAITAPLLVHLVGVFDKRWSPSDPEGIGYIFYSIAGMILAVPLWIWISYRAYRLIKRYVSPLGNPQ
jgi:Na+/proline symporter